MEIRRCRECGHPVDRVSKTRPMELCGECKRGRRRVKVRESFTCADCGGTFKPPAHTGKPPERCDPCRTERRRVAARVRGAEWRRANPERAREHAQKYNQKRRVDPAYIESRREYRLQKYGLTSGEFEALLAEQGEVCAICGGSPNGRGTRLHVDHCHDSGRIRGLLCGKCNTAIGLLDDNPERAEAAAAYLRR